MRSDSTKWAILAFVVLAVLAAVAVGGATFVVVLNRAAAERPEPTVVLPTATRAFPTVQRGTPTPRPTQTHTPAPTGTATSTPTPTSTPTSTPTPTPTPRVVITEIKSLGRLETVQFLMQTVIDLEREPSNTWQQIFGTDKLLLVAGGEVVAGFDLSKVEAEHITVRGDHVTLVLPPPEILYSRVDNQETYVYERTSGLFRKPDMRIEGEARQLAEQAMVERALRGDVLRQAEANGRLQLEAFLRSLGFTDVLIVVGSE